MDAKEIVKFLQMMGCQRISVGSQWVRSTCPAEYLHAKGRDTVPSFAISIHRNDTSFCRCQACGISGALDVLLWRMEAEGQRLPDEVFPFLTVHNQMDLEKLDLDAPPEVPRSFAARVRAAMDYVPRPRSATFVHPDEEPQAEVPEGVLEQMIADMPARVLEYLTRKPDALQGIGGRGLDRLIIQEWELGWHPLQQRICIPIRDEHGKLVAVSGRRFSDDDSKGPKYLHSRFKRDRVLFGEHRRNSSIRKGYLFEGFFQTIFSSQYGYKNVFARMGTHLSRQQATKLVRWLDHLVIVPDGDKAGLDAADRDARTLKDWRLVEDEREYHIGQIDIAPMPKGKDADTLFPDELRMVLGSPSTA